MNHPDYCNSTVNIFNHLYCLDLFDEVHLNFLTDLTSFSTLRDLFHMLTTTGIINNENADFLYHQFLPLLDRLANSEAINSLLFAIGQEHDFQAHHWQEIINMVQVQTPETELHAYVFNLLEHEQDLQLEIFPQDLTIEEMKFNNSQSTHTASVHRSVSESAKRLKFTYGADIELSKIINEMHEYFEGLERDDFKHAAAYRAFSKIISGDYAYFDETSNTTLLDLLILTWHAIGDDSKRIGDKTDVQQLWLQGLYEIQRDFDNFDRPSDPDNRICGSGGFNKMIQSLVGGHELVELQYLTMISLSYKLKASVQHLMLNYLKYFSNPLTLESFFYFNKMIIDIEINGLESYWPFIKKHLEIELFKEFASLFESQHCVQFKAIIDSGEYVEIENLKRFQKDIAASKGYYHFCHSILFQMPPKIDAQHEFDKRYGLIKR